MTIRPLSIGLWGVLLPWALSAVSGEDVLTGHLCHSPAFVLSLPSYNLMDQCRLACEFCPLSDSLCELQGQDW